MALDIKKFTRLTSYMHNTAYTTHVEFKFSRYEPRDVPCRWFDISGPAEISKARFQ
jgi:hypothetical protein